MASSSGDGRQLRLWVAAICPLAATLGAGCCIERDDAIKRHGTPDIVYELRGATGRWYWFGDKPSPHPLRPDEVGFIWLDKDYQATFQGDCQSYSGPLLSDDWRRFEQDRSEEIADEVAAEAAEPAEEATRTQ